MDADGGAGEPSLGPLGYGRQHVDEDDVAAVVEALRGDFLTQGPRSRAFEEGLARATGARDAVAVSNGTGALHVANLALGIGPGDLVVTSANTFLASATAALHAGADVEFVDVDPRTGNMDLDALEERLAREPQPTAVVAVQFAGLPLDMERLLALKRAHGFRLIEDAAHALGACYRAGGRSWRVGEHPDVDATCLSFHPVKHVTSGEGGAVLSHDDDVIARARLVASHGIDRASQERPFPESEEAPPWYGPMTALGFNYRMSELHAALGVSQLAKLEGFLARRREVAMRYLDVLGGCELPDPGDEAREHAWHLFVVRVDAERRDGIMDELRRWGVHTQLHYYPVPLQPWFRAHLGERAYPHAEAHARRSISLPIHPGITDADVDRVAAVLAEALEA